MYYLDVLNSTDWANSDLEISPRSHRYGCNPCRANHPPAETSTPSDDQGPRFTECIQHDIGSDKTTEWRQIQTGDGSADVDFPLWAALETGGVGSCAGGRIRSGRL